MKLVDLNVLLYAVNSDSAHHEAVSVWWESALNGDESIGLPWIVLLGFLRHGFCALRGVEAGESGAWNWQERSRVGQAGLTQHERFRERHSREAVGRVRNPLVVRWF